ncbi:hypothetical protein PtA15_7A478 [Puccinia triticina]|uniref:Uncharacterized protein n=1 Tax=Puccinia triticina TaxID=208348 RepID=A0ABY7CSK4_9BASI|nr:uncharacterized protein PtA15_7A478 [Puccinia triticina]WAQ86750.1 hypothetical protein PtA15_7A478 [Puccinia triticina]
MHEDPSQAAHSGDFLDQNTVGLMHPDEFHVRVQDPAGATPATQLTSSNPEPENLGDSSEIIRDGSTEAHQVHLANEVARFEGRNQRKNRQIAKTIRRTGI